MGIHKKSLAGVEYAGVAGSSADCKAAVLRFVQYGDHILSASILTSGNNHSLLLRINVGDVVAVRNGFSSGYSGEGPRTFSFILKLLEAHQVEIEEYRVGDDLLERLDLGALTANDLHGLEKARPVRPIRWHDYIHESDWMHERDCTLWQQLPPVMPFAIIDTRIMDLALRFFKQPDDCLMIGYRRLEDLVRKKIGLDEHSSKLFSQAFLGDKAKLGWNVVDPSEQVGRGTLFTAVYNAYRNPRAHREQEHQPVTQLTEFLLLNHLFLLEETAMSKP